MDAYVIVNPNSGGGATMKKWPRTCEKLEKVIGRFDYDFTNASGVATLLAAEAVKKGYRKIVAVGGDGTLHEVIQGLFENGELVNSEVLLGTIPSGTGTDFARTLKIPNDVDSAILKLKGAKIQKIDIGLVKFKDHFGAAAERYFFNMADVGLGGDVAERANNTPRVFGGFATYLFSSLISFASYKPKRVKIRADSKVISESVTSVFVANGRYFGCGMHIVPHAEIDDGLLDVVVVSELSKWDVFKFAPALYSGRLIQMAGVKYFQAKSVSIDTSEKILINLDGEQPGFAPVRFDIMPRVLRFMV